MKDFFKNSVVFGLVVISLEFVWFFTVGKTWIENSGCKVYVNDDYKGQSRVVNIGSNAGSK